MNKRNLIFSIIALISVISLVLFFKNQAIEKIEPIYLYSPQPHEVIKSPLIVKGKARGTWFFEGDFPVVLTNWDGLIISEGIATAQSDWMTEDFVPFKATLKFDNEGAYSNRGSLILIKDNPSGLPEHDDALEIEVVIENEDK